MSLELFRKKCFQRHHCDTLCNRGAGHSEHPSSACCASSSTRGVPLHPAALPAWDVREKGYLGETLWHFQLSGTLIACADAAKPFAKSRGNKDVERLPLDEADLNTLYSWSAGTCRVSSGIKTSAPGFASVTVANVPTSLSTAHIKSSLAPACTLTTQFSVRHAACDAHQSVQYAPQINFPEAQ